MSKKDDPKPRAMNDYAFALDWNKLNQKYPTPGLGREDPTMMSWNMQKQRIATSQLAELQAQIDESKEDAEYRRIQKQRLRAAGVPYGVPGAQQAPADDAISKLFDSPEFVAKFAEMSPEEKLPYMTMLQASQSRGNPYQQGQRQGMDPMFMYMMMQNQNKESISMKDLMTMFTTGMEQAMKLMNTQVQSQQSVNPMDMVTSVLNLMRPLMDKADTETQARFQAQLDAIGKKGSLAEQIGEIRAIVDTLGGGGATDYDLQIARIGAETNWRAMAMTQESMNKRLEHEAEIAKYEQLGAIASTAAAAAGPGIAQAVSNLASQQARGTYGQKQPQTPQMMQPHPSNRPGAQGKGRLMEAECPECNTLFTVPIPPGQPVLERITCPSCNAVLQPDLGGAPDGGDR